MELNVRAATQAEQIYGLPQSIQIQGQTGFIGCLSGSILSAEDTAWSGKVDPQFQDELAAVSDIPHHKKFHQYLLENDCTSMVYFRVDTEQLSCLLRVNADDNVYSLYCYERKWLNHHMGRAKQGIRFITPQYKEKFRIEDGDKVRIRWPDGTATDHVCRYIDEYHLEVGSGWNSLYHVCQFAEIMDQKGNTVIPLRRSLPEMCYGTVPERQTVVVFERGVDGYYTSSATAEDGSVSQEFLDAWNQEYHVTKAQAAAMKAGALFGWDAPAADPKNYNEQGEPIKSKQRDRGDAR